MKKTFGGIPKLPKKDPVNNNSFLNSPKKEPDLFERYQSEEQLPKGTSSSYSQMRNEMMTDIKKASAQKKNRLKLESTKQVFRTDTF